MKKLAVFSALSIALLSPSAQAQQTPAEKLSLNQSILCLKANAPANADALVAWIDRSTPKHINVNAVAHLAGTPPKATVPLNVCDVNTQAHAMLGLTSLVPASESTWHALFLRVDNRGNYNVFTDIAMEKMAKMAK